jgi:membrane associated rhomboid family serine protease
MTDQQYSPAGFQLLPPVVKNLLIINGMFFVVTYFFGVNLQNALGLHYFSSVYFQPYQFVTYMFIHAGPSHIIFNMFALWMFGYLLENVWGSKRFLTYYIITGIGAGLVQTLVFYLTYAPWEIMALSHNPNAVTIGASGAVYGILLAFGMMFPNMLVYIYFLFPIKAKWIVILYGAIELLSGISNRPGDNVAHFAHLGGMLFGLVLILYWKKKGHYY